MVVGKIEAEQAVVRCFVRFYHNKECGIVILQNISHGTAELKFYTPCVELSLLLKQSTTL